MRVVVLKSTSGVAGNFPICLGDNLLLAREGVVGEKLLV